MRVTHFKKIDQIQKQINKQKEKALIPLNKIIDYNYKKRLVVAKGFIEELRNHGTKKEPIMVKVKLMQYEDYFTDEDTGKTVTIQRHEKVEVNGKRCDHFGNEIKKLTINDI